MLRIGVISDTHGLLRAEARAFLRGCQHIVHGGDIGCEAVLQELAAIAPTSAVRGNNDTGPWAASLPEAERLRFEEVIVYVIHDLAHLELEPRAAGVNVVICGHSHQPRIEERDGVLHVNPGSAGPRRFRLPITAAELNIDGRTVAARIVELVGRGGARSPGP